MSRSILLPVGLDLTRASLATSVGSLSASEADGTLAAACHRNNHRGRRFNEVDIELDRTISPNVSSTGRHLPPPSEHPSAHSSTLPASSLGSDGWLVLSLPTLQLVQPRRYSDGARFGRQACEVDVVLALAHIAVKATPRPTATFNRATC